MPDIPNPVSVTTFKTIENKLMQYIRFSKPENMTSKPVNKYGLPSSTPSPSGVVTPISASCPVRNLGTPSGLSSAMQVNGVGSQLVQGTGIPVD